MWYIRVSFEYQHVLQTRRTQSKRQGGARSPRGQGEVRLEVGATHVRHREKMLKEYTGRLQAQINERKLMRGSFYSDLKKSNKHIQSLKKLSCQAMLRHFVRSLKSPCRELNTYIPKPDSDGYDHTSLFVATGALKEYYTSLPAGNVQILKSSRCWRKSEHFG